MRVSPGIGQPEPKGHLGEALLDGDRGLGLDPEDGVKPLVGLLALHVFEGNMALADTAHAVQSQGSETPRRAVRKVLLDLFDHVVAVEEACRSRRGQDEAGELGRIGEGAR